MSPRGWLALLAMVLGCIDYTPAGKPEKRPGLDTSSSTADTAPADSGDTAALASEECDGVDNDDDGVVDEGFADADADAIADCVDDTCAIPLDVEEPESDPHTCEATAAPPADPWAIEVLWERQEDYCYSPVAGDLFRDGGAEIVCVNRYGGYLQVIEGATGTTMWSRRLVHEYSGVALADLDGDGVLEILAFSPTETVLALTSDGSVLWESSERLASGSGFARRPIEVADLGGDGAPEVIIQSAILHGRDGSLLAQMSFEDFSSTHRDIAVADVDGDDSVDILTAWARYADDGSQAWRHAPSNEEAMGALPLLVQADTDDDAEVVWYANDVFAVLEPDGTVLTDYPGVGDRTTSIACAGDLDGNGEMELVGMGPDASRAWSLDGSVLWEATYRDETVGTSGCTTFDFDLDGRKEVVYGDGEALRIVDADGTELYTDERFSGTYDDRVLVVDLDDDGSVEIVSTTHSEGYATRAYRNVNRDWPPGTNMWPSSTWSGTSLLPDGRVPRTPQLPWLTTGVWRGQPEAPVFGSDLRPALGDVCVASCEDAGEVRVEVRLQNLGPDEIEAGAPLAVYGLDTSGARVLLEVKALEDWLDDGRSAASWEVVTTTEQAKRGLVFVAGDDGTGAIVDDDCAVDNNELAWALTECG